MGEIRIKVTATVSDDTDTSRVELEQVCRFNGVSLVDKAGEALAATAKQAHEILRTQAVVR